MFAVIWRLAAYGTGAPMPPAPVPLIGAAPVVPIIAISAIFTISAARRPIFAMSIAAAR